ncbi:M23 family metallopeptidase [Polyangium fumosum]|uniref:M23 family metallopeptidase n=1 Tax=Polyangium fumosum TaxID=889272 RepID=A0A4V5PN81_9BACT|nr:M23 family metallopeptidase [Polyangium fumosum]
MISSRFSWLILASTLVAVPSCIVGDDRSETDDVEGAGAEVDGPVGAVQQPITVAGLGHYCSARWPSGGWAFNWFDSATSDPCTLLNLTATGGSIARAGVYATNDTNNVVVRCDGGFVTQRVGTGGAPLAAAFTDAGNRNGCFFTVAPKVLRLFDAPFNTTTTTYTPSNGVDFARQSIPSLDVTQFGQVGSTTATIVNHDGEEKTFGNNHDGYDWLMPRGTPLLAVADGTVVKARFWYTGATNSDGPFQGEIYIDHTISRSPSTYNETFRSSYFHLQTLYVADGDTVTKGQVIGDSGNYGDSSAPHLHFAVFRMTNTANDWHATHTINASGNDGQRLTIDPYGWFAPQGFDPWAFRAYSAGMGALSIWLWNVGKAPSTGAW